MSNVKVAKNMRWIAGILYGLFFLFEFFSLKGFLGYNASYGFVGVGDVPMLVFIEIGVALGAAAFAAWLFSGMEEIWEGHRRAIVVLTVLYVLFELIFYSSHTLPIQYTLAYTFPFTNFINSTNLGVALMVMVMIRLVLVILAAFFITSAKYDLMEDEEGFEEDEEEGEEGEEGDDSDDDQGDDEDETVEEIVILSDEEGEVVAVIEESEEEQAEEEDDEAEEEDKPAESDDAADEDEKKDD